MLLFGCLFMNLSIAVVVIVDDRNQARFNQVWARNLEVSDLCLDGGGGSKFEVCWNTISKC
jgi:hypothetical protein